MIHGIVNLIKFLIDFYYGCSGFDRTDDAITICEIKYYNKPFAIDKNYYNNILNKISVFKKVTKTKKQILIAFITKSGLKENSCSDKLGCKFITLDDILD